MNWLATTHSATGEQLQEYINHFKLNVVHAKYDEIKDATTLISYFSTGIPVGLMQHIQAMDNVPSVAHAPPAMVFFFLVLFAPLLAAALLTIYVTLCKPGCAVSAVDMSLV